MICIEEVKKYCKDYTNIENYEQAVNDNEIWDCHHRDEIRTLPSGIIALRTMEELKEIGRYYDCPANELIFLSHKEHSRLHALNRSETTRSMWSKSHTGMTRTKETKYKISKSRTGIVFSNEHKANLSKAKKGKPQSEFGRKFFEHYNIISKDNGKLYIREKRYYKVHGKCSWE